uniref:Uncharacterized protein n=1 Tax=Oryza sativa subsp. japonica TaxID=39947 RepID=Q5ZCA0_ORYSJ|nr:hypothetical protein [Oryza sativa Japonica Group]BAD88340.1 hypothetical protein [Oryza sativa Japonica Group]
MRRRGLRGPEEAGTWARRRRLEEGDGPDRWAPPVGDPGREEGGGRLDWASACRPAQREEGGKREWAGGPIERKREKKKEKEGKRIFLGLNIAFAQF